jgi:signal transduction histidine kinase/ActR/RegA family two-component response regulator
VPAVSSKGENLAEKMRDLILAPERFLHTENENLCRDGRRIWVGWSNQPVFGEQHQLKEILCVGVDLTTKKKDDESRRRHELEMQHLQRLESLGLLAGGIAHDFNNLLTAILANVSLVRMDTPPNSENSGLLHEAEKASLQARDLTTQLLTFAKGGKPVKTPVNLEKIIRDCAGFALRGKNARCEFNFSASLHPVEADAAQIAQVFNNLFLNACQAMPGGGRISVTAQNRTVIGGDSTLATSGDYVEVTVADEGEGIGSENLPKIFDPYFTTKKTGSGLGLAVVHSIVSNHLGAITAESQPGHGTKFILLLPASHQTPVAPAAVTDISETACRRVLVMDDEEMVRRVLEKILVRLGCEVHSVPDGQAALDAYQKAAAEKKPFDLVIMDLTVPGGMGGQECVRRLLMLDPQARAIVSSGYADNPVLADHHAYGFRSVVTKPYTTVQMQAAMQIALAP